ncbi:MAG: hypothetical protein K2X42_03965 [Burkholderiaceae bacterium]|nr:hypothetical protein [Burkholderiaceae bacterium]
MLRGLLLALLLANLVFFVWSQGGLGKADGSAPGGEREPERLSRQVNPEALQLLRPTAAAPGPEVSASAVTAAEPAASGIDAASAPSSAPAEAASAPAAAEASASAALPASAASVAAVASAVVLAPTPAPPPPPPGTRCLEAGPFSGLELASAETALAANAKTRRIARRWVQVTASAASAPAAPQHLLRIDATPSEVAVLEALPASVVGRSFAPCTAR